MILHRMHTPGWKYGYNHERWAVLKFVSRIRNGMANSETIQSLCFQVWTADQGTVVPVASFQFQALT